MKIFGTVQPILESSEASLKIGRLVANYEFFSALFKFSDFNEYHIFCPSYANCKLTQEKFLKSDLAQNRKERIKVYHISSLKDSLEKINYDIFHLGGWGYFYPGFVHLRNLYSKKLFPITGITHSLNAKEAPYHALKICNAPTMPFDSVVCTSVCGKKVLRNLFDAAEKNFKQINIKYHGRMDVIPLGIDDKYRTIPTRKNSRTVLGIDNDAFVILSLGRLETNNKMDYAPFLNTIKRFVEKNKDKKINLVIAGGCDKLSHSLLNELIKDNKLDKITKLFINFEDELKPHLYRAANIYASPIDNFQETFGISVVEAMVHECTVVVSDFDGYSELVDQNINGIKIPTYWSDITDHFQGVSEIMNASTWQLLLSQSVAVDFDKMQETLQKMLDNPEKCDAMGKRARVNALQKYLWSTVIRQYCRLWDDLAKDAKDYSSSVRKTKNPFELDYWKVFSHYPSNLISGKTKIALSDYGKDVLETGKMPTPYSDVSASIIIPQLISIAINILEEDTCTVSKFIDALKKNAEVSDSIALYYILWMTKYNLIKIL
ncbi:MAG: hypothetical protein A2Y12_08030 [Planctomycetes bacterium GWF2_42_9]|nr:MAG: hypothetical protein A2Y12_08030 [Planctomycetes bacterium GWF2_42_9]HAL44821.1 hypothetical protein [Phycisphaerales bacterium]